LELKEWGGGVGGKEREMTQILYAHMNKQKKKGINKVPVQDEKKKRVISIFIIVYFSS
jgi:hypothetical protein